MFEILIGLVIGLIMGLAVGTPLGYGFVKFPIATLTFSGVALAVLVTIILQAPGGTEFTAQSISAFVGGTIGGAIGSNIGIALAGGY